MRIHRLAWLAVLTARLCLSSRCVLVRYRVHRIYNNPELAQQRIPDRDLFRELIPALPALFR